MAILIPNMEMPESCHVCVGGYGGFCFVAPAESDAACPDHGRPDWCPLVAVPVRMTPDLALLEAAGLEM